MALLFGLLSYAGSKKPTTVCELLGKIYRAAREFHMLERCVTSLPPHGSPREPIWNFSTWLQMPRGRLIMWPGRKAERLGT